MNNVLRKIFYLLQAMVDRIKGVDFISGVASKHMDHVEYAASTPFIYSVLNSYFNEEEIGEKDAIMDIGCGKGRMLVFFSRFPFGKVGGVEYEEDIVQICKCNLSKLKVYRVDVRQGDAALYDDYDEYNYFYMFNPFHRDYMQGFLNNLKKSRERRDRDIRVLYLNPVDIEMFLNNGFAIEKQLQHGVVILKN